MEVLVYVELTNILIEQYFYYIALFPSSPFSV